MVTAYVALPQIEANLIDLKDLNVARSTPVRSELFALFIMGK